ncbi:molybdopterin oxidoreductase [Bdellovibrionota bacterium FG-1]
MEHTKIRDPGAFQVSAGAKVGFLFLAALGIGTFIFGLSTDPSRVWAAFLHNHFYFMCLGLGGLFFAALQWMTGAMWSAPVRRVSEAFTAYLPFALVTMGILYFGIHHLYLWSHAEHVKGDLVLEGKAGWLSPVFFILRDVGAVALWWFFARKMVGHSIAQDTDGAIKHTLANRKWAPVFTALFAITFTMVSYDLLMSLDPHWFSTMYGVYCFAGLFYSNLALTCIVSIYLVKQGKLKGIVNDNHLHDLGKFMFAISTFWAYIGFSQFMLIWYANLPEETEYFMRRMVDGWFYVSVFLLVGKFVMPFFLLLSRDSKRSSKTLVFVGCWMLFAQWVDVMWLVQPEFFKEGPRFGLLELGMFLGFAGVFLFLVTRFLGRHSVVAIGDPRLEESVFHHHQ